MIKILGIASSPRKGATEAAVKLALHKAASVKDVETEFISLRGKELKTCNHCDYCVKHKKGCVIQDDMQEITEKFLAADGYIIGSPVYTMNVTPQLLTFFNRLRFIRHLHPQGLFTKVGGAIAVGGTRNGGQEITLSTIINCYLARGIVVVGGSIGHYAGGKVWNHGNCKNCLREDENGMISVEDIGIRVAYATKAMKEGGRYIEEYYRDAGGNRTVD